LTSAKSAQSAPLSSESSWNAKPAVRTCLYTPSTVKPGISLAAWRIFPSGEVSSSPAVENVQIWPPRGPIPAAMIPYSSSDDAR
jgi:hypothetical protein